MKQKITPTDLHVKYKLEENEWFQWENGRYAGSHYHSTDGYSWEYARWIEEKYLELYNKTINLENREEQLEQDIQYINDELAIASQEIRDLKEDLEAHWEKEAGADL